ALGAAGTLTGLVDVGADRPGTVSLDNSAIPALVAQGLTSQGNALSYDISGNTLTAFIDTGTPGLDAGDSQIFTLSIGADGSYSFNLLGQLDHPAGNGENDLNIDLSSIIKVTDFDGDSINLDANSFLITVHDDIPFQNAAQVIGLVDEGALPAGNPDAPPPP